MTDDNAGICDCCGEYATELCALVDEDIHETKLLCQECYEEES
jgi:hypothetical protein